MGQYFSASVSFETPLDPQDKYIFGNMRPCPPPFALDSEQVIRIFSAGGFPHGTATISHGMSMTDMCGFLTTVFSGDRRDLSATILFYIPVFREFCLWWGCVDAGKNTATYNLKRERSLFIFLGGEVRSLLMDIVIVYYWKTLTLFTFDLVST
jgi:hypothetical protein